jgi:hypothetical protein
MSSLYNFNLFPEVKAAASSSIFLLLSKFVDRINSSIEDGAWLWSAIVNIESKFVKELVLCPKSFYERFRDTKF